MEENSLNPGDTIGQWTVDRHIANGCIYAVTREDDPNQYALKLRASHNRGRFRKEIDILQRLNEPGVHPTFQRIIDYSGSELWMVLSPLVEPDWLAGYAGMSESFLAKIEIKPFFEELVDGFRHACSCGVYMRSADIEIYVRPDGGPLFVDIEFSQLTQTDRDDGYYMDKKSFILGLLKGYNPIEKVLMVRGLLELLPD